MHIPLGLDGWYLCRWLDPADAEASEFHGDEASALRLVCQFRDDSLALNRVRGEIPRTAAEPLSDDELLRYVSWELASGRWKARKRTKLWLAGISEPDSAAPPAAFPLAAKSSGPRQAAPPPDPPVFPDDIDAPAIAKVLTNAAVLGVPFCEECAKAAAAAAGRQ